MVGAFVAVMTGAAPPPALDTMQMHAPAAMVPPFVGPDRWALMLVVATLSGGALLGFFKTKTSGFGRYNTSALMIIIALSFASIALIAGLMREQAFSSLLMAVIGFAGGMVVGKERP